MTPSWRTLEREITEILRSHHFIVERAVNNEYGGDLMLTVPAYDFPLVFSLTTFAKDLAKRLEAAT